MLRSSGAKIGLGVVAFVGVLALLKFEPWKGGEGTTTSTPDGREKLVVGFLPVT